jgi:hypothetical protein
MAQPGKVRNNRPHKSRGVFLIVALLLVLGVGLLSTTGSAPPKASKIAARVRPTMAQVPHAELLPAMGLDDDIPHL